MTGPYGNQPHRNQPGQPQRRGFFASLSAALTPPPMPDDDSGPLKAPKGVLAAMVLAIVAGAIFILSGGLSLDAWPCRTWFSSCVVPRGPAQAGP